jgi:hypothetical protein
VVWRRIDKITRYLAASLTSFREAGLSSGYGPAFLPTGIVTAEEVLLALSKPADDADIEALYEGTAIHPLLTNRIFTLRKCFIDPKF